MMRAFSLATLATLILSVANHSTADAATLKFKFPNGRETTTETHIKSSQTLSLAGMNLESGSDQKLTVTTVNGTRGPADGTLKIQSKIDAIEATVSLPGGTELEFDSAEPDADPPGTQFDFVLDIFKATSKSKWTTTMNSDNRVVSIDGRGDAFNDLPDTLKEATKAQFDPTYLKTVANDELDKFPTSAVEKGETWERSNTMRLDSGQKLTFTGTMTYVGTVQMDGKELQRVTSKTTAVEYTVDANAPLKVVNSDLKVVDSDGEILFDANAGQIVSQHGKTHIKGSLTLEIMGNELPGNLDLTMENSTKLK